MNNQVREIREAQLMSKAELARKAGIETPMIDAVYALIAERARHL